MDEVKKVALIDIQVKTDEAAKRLGELAVAEKEAIAKIKELSKSYTENATAIAGWEIRLKEVRTAKTNIQNLTQKEIGLNKAATGSVNDLKNRIAILTDEYNKLSQEERENTDVGRSLTRQIKELSDEHKAAKSAIGDNRLEVGSYKDAIQEAIVGNTQFGKTVSEVGVAFKANPIGFFVSALISLLSIMKESKPIMEFIEDITSRIGAGFDVLKDRVFKVAEGFKEFFSGNFTKSADLFKESMKGIGDEMEREIKLAGELTRARQQLERDEINSIANSKRLIAEEEKLKNIRDNEFNSIQDRIAANEKAAALEQKRLKDEEARAQRRVDLLQKEAERRGGLAKISNEQLTALREAELKLEDVREEAAGRENEFITNRYQLEQEKLDDLRTKKEQALADQLAAIEIQLLRVKQGSDEEIKIIEQQILKERDIELSAEGLTQNQKQAIILKAEKEIADKRKEFSDKLIEDRRKEAEELMRMAKEQADELIELERSVREDNYKLSSSTNGEAAKQKLLELTNQLSTEEITRAEFEKRKEDNELKSLERQLATAKLFGKETTDLEQAIADKKLSIAEKDLADKQRLEDARFNMLQVGSQALGDLLSLTAKSSSEAAEFQKTIALFQIGIDTAQAISGLTAISFKSGNLITAITALAGGTATIIANIAKAKALLTAEAPQPSFYEGGEFGYTGDGTPTDESRLLGKKQYTYHKRELIVPDRVLQTEEGGRLGRRLLQMIHSNRPAAKVNHFYSGGMFDGGATVREAATSVDNQKSMTADLIKVVQALPAPVVGVHQIEKGLSDMQTTKVIGDLS